MNPAVDVTESKRYPCHRSGAQVLGVSEEVVKTRLSRAKAALRRDLLDRVGAGASHAFAFHQSRCDRVVAAVFERIGGA